MNASTPPPERLAHYAESLAALRRGLERAHQFAIFLALCNAKNTIEQAVQALSASIDSAILEVRVAPDTQDVLQAIEQASRVQPLAAIMLTGLDAVLSDPARARALLGALNLRRSEWPVILKMPVVFWVSHQSAHVLLNGAPDFFDWRSDTLEFPELTQVENKVFGVREWNWGADPHMTLPQRQARVVELRQRIALAGDDAPRTKAAWLDELGDHLVLMGDWDEAQTLRQQELLPIFERTNAVREVAMIRGKIADILRVRGDLAGALRIRRDEELPVFESLGAVREAAITRGKIADILQARGDLDGALAIRRLEQLPVFEKLGDVREVAITKGQIADILQLRGEFEGALRIRRDEELPVYEKLGDVLSVAITKGQIADILQSRGDLEDALRIRLEEELPLYEKLGAIREIAITKGCIAQILQARGDLEGALLLHRERLPVTQQMQDMDSQAHTEFSIAQILSARIKAQPGDLGEINDCLASAFSITRRQGRLEGIAIVGKTYADFLITQNQPKQAQKVRTRSDAAFAELRRQGVQI